MGVDAARSWDRSDRGGDVATEIVFAKGSLSPPSRATVERSGSAYADFLPLARSYRVSACRMRIVGASRT